MSILLMLAENLDYWIAWLPLLMSILLMLSEFEKIN